ncbi:Biopolymer transport protein ExbD/TolR [Archangium gephyra]|uniref:Biopolymer transport protein ExbD/TolR n=1 Tax=Archangium gephyra TaxID=48 RepID=A0AAC8Q631_9BACT|nr:Biopolymer transport protein ExbD/TolR [Archangium gephyra]
MLPQGQANADINVTPLVDVVLVLLIIFMVVTPIMNQELVVKLPLKEEPAHEAPEASQVVVTVTPEGHLTLNNEPISEADYIPRLTRVLAARPAGDRLLFFTADDRAPYGRVVAALDGAKAAGAEVLGLMTAPP